MIGTTGVKSLEEAKKKAEELVQSDEKVSGLIAEARDKAKRNYEFLLGPWESLQILMRMIRAWVSGRYSVPLPTILAGVAALIYFVDPFDLVPDSVPVFGFLDDAAVIAAVVRLNLGEISRFRRWEVSLPSKHPPGAD